MAFGILEDATCVQPHGTTRLESVAHASFGTQAQVILKPKPSNSLKDPLNLSPVRKELLFTIVILGACFTGAIGPVLVSGFEIIAKFFDVTLQLVTLLNGALVMSLGVSSYLCSCLALVYGKRLIFLITTVLLVVSCIWAAAAQSYNSLIAAPIFQGLGMGCFYALAGTATINDVFFIHQRGTRAGLWNFAVIVSVNVTPIISGYVIVDLGWRWSFGILAIAFGVLFCGGLTSSTHSNEKRVALTPEDTSISLHEKSTYDNKPLWKRILGIELVQFGNQKRIIELCIAPVLLIRRPSVIWACAMWSVTFSWLIFIGAVADQIFQAPPYNLSATHVGNLVGIAPLIGSALGTISSGWTSDWISKRLAIRNGGVYEPEFRLWIMLPFAVTIAARTFGLGMAVDAGLSSIVCGVFLAILIFAVGVGCTGIVSYSNDICLDRAGEAFGITMFIKSSFAFGLSFMINNYYAEHRPKVFFFTFGGLTLGVTAFTVPLYIFGKKIRGWEMRHNII